ncbi:hypothetical protein Ancab_023226 [Ancistrocladus abbreviatus]
MDSRQVDDEARIRHKHQALLQEYLALQKEFVSKKRKLQEAKQRKEILLEEVRYNQVVFGGGEEKREVDVRWGKGWWCH